MSATTNRVPGAYAYAGKSIYELLWEELDVVIDRLMSIPDPDGRDPGRAEGLATAIAIMRNPYVPVPQEMNDVKEMAMVRWAERSGEPPKKSKRRKGEIRGD